MLDTAYIALAAIFLLGAPYVPVHLRSFVTAMVIDYVLGAIAIGAAIATLLVYLVVRPEGRRTDG